MGVCANLYVPQLIFIGSEINDQIGLQWSSILATTILEFETTRGANLLVQNSYH